MSPERSTVQPSRGETLALTAILFLLFLAGSFCLAVLLGYIEMQRVPL